MARNLERPGSSFREAVAFLHSSRLSIRTGERLEPVKNPSRRSSLLVYRARLSDTQPWLPSRTRSDREGCAHHESARGSFQHPV